MELYIISTDATERPSLDAYQRRAERRKGLTFRQYIQDNSQDVGSGNGHFVLLFMISAPISHRGMLYQGAYYPPLVGAEMSALPSRNPGAVSTVKPAYDVTFAKEAMSSSVNAPIAKRAPLSAKAAFKAQPVIGGVDLGPDGLADNGVRTAPYAVTQANRAYQQTIQGL